MACCRRSSSSRGPLPVISQEAETPAASASRATKLTDGTLLPLTYLRAVSALHSVSAPSSANVIPWTNPAMRM
jgi:hypothetical protein